MPEKSSGLSLAFACAGHAYSHIFMLLYATVVLALEGIFELPFAELMLLSLPGFIAFGVCALPAGWLGDRWSAMGMLTVFFVGTGCASILTGLAQTPLDIGVGLTLIGVFASIYHPVGTAWVVRHATRRGKALGVNGLFGNLGVAAAALAAGALTDLVSWRAAFIVPGAIAIATGVAFALFARSGAMATRTTDRVAQAEPARADTIRMMCVIAVTSMCGGLIFQSMTIGLPKVFDLRLTGLVTGTMGVGIMVSIVYAVAGFAQIAVGHLVDRYPLKPLFSIIFLLQAPLLFLAADLFDLPLMLIAIVFVFLNVGALPISEGVVARYTPVDWRATIYGAKFVIALGVASLAVPMVALIHERTGDFALLFTILGTMALVVAAAALFLPSERRAPAVAASLEQAD